MKKTLRHILSCLAFFVVGLSAKAQGDWLFIPGYEAGDSTLIQAWFDYQAGSNGLNNALLNDAIYRSEIPAAAAIENSDRLDGNQSRTGGYAEGEVWYRSGGEGMRWMVGTGFRELFGARLQDDLYRLYLRGNGPYEDEQLDLGPSRLFVMSSQFIAGGLERSSETFTLGLTLKLSKVGRYQRLEMDQSSLYTAPYGEYVESELAMTYETAGSEQAKLAAWYGTGFSFGTYLDWRISERTRFSVQVKDLGLLMFQGLNRASVDTNYRFEGAEVNNILQLDDTLFRDGELDSLEALLGLDVSNQSTTRLSPGYAQFGLHSQLGDRLGLRVMIRQWWQAAAATELTIGMPWNATEAVKLEPTLRLGGWSGVVIGLGAYIAASEHLHITVRTEQFQNLLAPDGNAAQSLMTGLTLRF